MGLLLSPAKVAASRRRPLAKFKPGLTEVEEKFLSAHLRRAHLPSVMPREECGKPYCPPDIDEHCSYDGLTRRIYIHDPAPAKCSVCGRELYPGAIDLTGLSGEEIADLEYDMENFRSVRPCEQHLDDPVIWAPTITVMYRMGDPSAELDFQQGGKPVNPLQLSREALSFLSLVLTRLDEWARATERMALANADRDPGDESPSYF